MIYLGVAALIVLICAVTWAWALKGTFGACVKGSTSEYLQRTIATLNDTIDLGIKLSVTLVGVGAAALIGFRTGIRLTNGMKMLLLLCVLLFGQSAMAGVAWRLPNSWLNQCLNLITEDIMQRLFEICFAFFLAGLGVTLVMVCFATWSSARANEGK